MRVLSYFRGFREFKEVREVRVFRGVSNVQVLP